jgi:hypothetical protein
MNLNQHLAVAVLCRERLRRGKAVPRYTPARWFESDLFFWTPAGYVTEFEIKLSLADFRADASKETRVDVPGKGPVMVRKHAALAAGCTDGPTRFFFVTPAGLIPPGEIPPWAGLIELQHIGGRRPYVWQWAETMPKPAPALHREKAREDVLKHALGVCYFRMHELLNQRLRWKLDQANKP